MFDKNLCRKLSEIIIFFSSPRDIIDEKQSFPRIIGKINRIKANAMGIVLKPISSEDTVPGVGRAQELINKDFKKSHIVVMLFWKRWGTPTGDYSSGCEEEYYIARKLRKEILIYFRKISSYLLKQPNEQLTQVLSFKKNIAQKQVYYHEYEDETDWENIFESDISSWLDDHFQDHKSSNFDKEKRKILTEKILELLNEFLPEDIAEEFDVSKYSSDLIFRKLNDIANTLNSDDPYYEHVVSINSKGAKYSIIPKNEEAATKEPLRFNLDVKIKNKDGKITKLNELLHKKALLKEDIILNRDEVEKIELFKGDKLLASSETLGLKELKISQRKIPLPVKMLIPDTTSSYDHMLLNVTRKTDQHIVFSNLGQEDYPIYLSLILNKEKREILFNLDSNIIDKTILDAWKFEKFLYDLVQKNKLVFINENNNKPVLFCNSKFKIKEFPDNTLLLEYYRRAVIIQQTLGIQLPWPNILTKNDMLFIDKLYQAISEGSIYEHFEITFIFRKDTKGQKSINSLKKEGYIDKVRLDYRTFDCILFGKRISLSGRFPSSFRMKPKEDVQNVIKQYEDTANKEINVVFETFLNEPVEFKFDNLPKANFESLEELYI